MRALVAAAVLLAGPALAQPAPPSLPTPLTLPTHDVAVVYRADGAARDAIPGGVSGPVRVAWSAERQLLRVEPEGRTQVLLVNLAAASVKVVDSGLHSAMSLPVRAKDLEPLTLRDAHLTRRGRSTVAGRACTDYAVESRRGHGTLCLTDDGIALRADGEVDGKRGSFTAVSVTDGRLPPGLFEVPQGYMQLALPGLSGFR